MVTLVYLFHSNLTPSDIEGVWWQLEEGSTATTYEPYYNYELAKIGTYQDRISKSSGKQLFDKNNYTKGFYFNSNGEIVSGTNWGYAYVPCEPNTTYIASGMKNYSTPSFIEVDENKNFIANLFNKTGESSKTFTTTTGKYIGVSFVWNNSVGNGGEIDTLMLNEGSIALPYEPYGTGWYIEKNIGKLILDGSQNITLNTSTPRRFNANYSALGLTNIKEGTSAEDTTLYYRMNDHFIYSAGQNTWGRYYLYNNWLVLLDSGSVIASANDLKTWLASNNTTILYVQEAPTYTEITNTTLIEELNELEKMYSYSGQTNISVNGNLPMIINVTALKNLS